MGIIARQSIKASIVSLVGVAIGAVTRLFIYTNYLTKSEIGILETIIKLGILISPFFIFGAPQVITKYFQRINKDKTDSGLIYTYILLLVFVLIPISTVIYLLGKDFIFSLYVEAPELKKYFILPIIVAISMSGFNFIRSYAIINLRITVPAFLSGVLDRIFILFLLIFYGVFSFINFDQFLYLNIFLFFVVPFILALLYVILVLDFKLVIIKIKDAFVILRKTYVYNSFLVLGTVSGVIIAAIDVNMISGKLGTALAGVYTIAFFMGTVIEIPKRSLNNIIYPILNKAIISKNKSELRSLYKKSSINQFFVGSFIFLVVWYNVDAIFEFIPNGQDFKGGKLVVFFIGLSKLFDMLMGVNKQIIELSSYYKYNFLINLLLSILIVLLNLVFIDLDSPYFGGINGVAFASLLAVFISNFLAFLVVWYKERTHPFDYNHLKIILVIIISIIIHFFIHINNIYLYVMVQSFLLVLLFLTSSLILNISKEFNQLFNSFIARLR